MAVSEDLQHGRHRLSTIRAADVIFVLDQRGLHDQLVGRGGLYARLYEEQFGAGAVRAFCSDGIVLTDGRCVRPAPAETRSAGVIPSPLSTT